MYLIGYDLGSSSVKASLLNVDKGECAGRVFAPEQEMPMVALQTGWAEQDPEEWWKHLREATLRLLSSTGVDPKDIKAIGISYQMHGLVCVDATGRLVRKSIIWCDSRAVSTGVDAFNSLGDDYCRNHLLNSPGNFTASKLRWVQQNEPDIYRKIHKIMLPGDYIAMKLTGEISTTISGLSEGVFWDFSAHEPSKKLLEYYQTDPEMLPGIVPTFGVQGYLCSESAALLGLNPGTPVSYRAGDQPNNALSLNVLKPGEVAATAGTSGVVYGVSSKPGTDEHWRVNSFAHVNHSQEHPRLGVLLCINSVGILNSWLRSQLAGGVSYSEMNNMASKIDIGSDKLIVLPFGNGAERMLVNKVPGCTIGNLHFTTHTKEHLFRAAQEGIAFSFARGMEIMNKMGIDSQIIRAGHANMFLSPIFRQTLANTTGATIELFDTDGALGAAIGAGLGAGVFTSEQEAFASLKKIETVIPQKNDLDQTQEAYSFWKEWLERIIPQP